MPRNYLAPSAPLIVALSYGTVQHQLRPRDPAFREKVTVMEAFIATALHEERNTHARDVEDPMQLLGWAFTALVEYVGFRQAERLVWVCDAAVRKMWTAMQETTTARLAA